MTILDGLSDENQGIILRASKKLNMPPEVIIDYLITKDIEAIISSIKVIK